MSDPCLQTDTFHRLDGTLSEICKKIDGKADSTRVDILSIKLENKAEKETVKSLSTLVETKLNTSTFTWVIGILVSAVLIGVTAIFGSMWSMSSKITNIDVNMASINTTLKFMQK